MTSKFYIVKWLAAVALLGGCAFDPGEECELEDCNLTEDIWDDEAPAWHDPGYVNELDGEVARPSRELEPRSTFDDGVDVPPSDGWLFGDLDNPEPQPWHDEPGGEEDNPEPQPWRGEAVNPEPQPWTDPFATAAAAAGPNAEQEPDPQPW